MTHDQYRSDDLPLHHILAGMWNLAHLYQLNDPADRCWLSHPTFSMFFFRAQSRPILLEQHHLQEAV